VKSREFGTVATYNGSYAFIKPDTADKDVFAQASELPGSVSRGDRVSYDLLPDTYKPGRLCAKSVRFVEEGESQQNGAAGMYGAEEASKTALAEGLQKLLRNGETQCR
jgi:cold shock CspA family protein